MTRQPQTAIVTGAGTGIGRAIAADLAADRDIVVLLGRREDVLARTASELEKRHPQTRLIWHRCDVANPHDVDAVTHWLDEQTDASVDVLVNNAGGGASSLAVTATVAEAAQHASGLLSGNLLGAFLMCHALRPRLARPGGRIVNLSSIAAVRGGGDVYAAAKAGVIGLTRALAGELGPEGITVNAVAPGLVLETEFFGDAMTAERRQATVAQIPLARAGRPQEIAAAVRYLASPAADYVTGEILHVNGGWELGR